MAECKIYWDRNFQGPSAYVTGSVDDLRDYRIPGPVGGHFGDNWNDEISSIQVISGVWRFCEHVNFGGAAKELGPGNYPWVPDIGIPDDWISSIQLMRE